MKIVVDAMGTDAYPTADVAGAVMAAREFRDTVILTGDENAIRQELGKHNTHGLKLEVVHASDIITMEDKPSIVGKSKPNSSMHVGMNLVKQGQADGFVTAGNTGAAHAIAMLYTLKRIQGVKRPALTAIFPINKKPVIFLDVGANADSKPEWLAQFAIMGNLYASKVLKLDRPQVGLLSNGEEEGKGNQLIQETSALLAHMSLNFIGNVEPKEVLHARADVVVSDGFTGNILIKTFEASTRYLGNIIRDEIRGDVFSTLGGLLARRAFRRARRRIDTFEVGGAPLLGVNGVVIISHGSSTSAAVKNAIHQARKAVEGRVIEAITAGIAEQPGESVDYLT